MPTPDQLPDDLKSLAYRNSLTLSHLDWEGNVQKLVSVVRKFVGEPQDSKQAAADPILDRLEDQISYSDMKSSRCQHTYKRIKVAEIIAASTVAVLSVMHLADNHDYTRYALALGAALLAVLIVIFEGLLQINRYQEIWTASHATCEALKREKFTYMTGGEFYASAANPRSLLAERIETIASQENTR
jgi:hypothetical protein